MFRELLKEQKLTQTQLAEKIEKKQQTVSKWLTGKSVPSVATMRKLATILKCDITVIIEHFNKQEE